MKYIHIKMVFAKFNVTHDNKEEFEVWVKFPTFDDLNLSETNGYSNVIARLQKDHSDFNNISLVCQEIVTELSELEYLSMD